MEIEITRNSTKNLLIKCINISVLHKNTYLTHNTVDKTRNTLKNSQRNLFQLRKRFVSSFIKNL